MAEQQLYIRVRGRILGPYDEDKLRSMAQRGQFSRMHEVSTDGLNWVRASTYAELFTGNSANGSGNATSTATAEAGSTIVDDFQIAGLQPAAAAASSPAPQASQPAASSGGTWYYTSAGQEYGPVDFATLQRVAAHGQIAAFDQVWTEGFPNWKPASEVPGLLGAAAGFAAGSTVGRTTTTTDDTSQAPESAIRELQSSKPWILFIAIVITVTSVILFIGAIVMLANAPPIPLARSAVVGNALMAMAMAVVQGVASALLYLHCNRLSDLRMKRTCQSLEAALRTIRVFWMFTGIVTLVVIALFVLGVGVMIAASGSLV